MNTIKASLIYLVSCAIRGRKAEQSGVNNIEWEKLLEDAQAHQIKGLIYCALPKSYNVINIDNSTLEKWKKETMLTAVWQMKNIRQVSCILGKFNEYKIPVIVLKGLVIREFYPRPELRTMCDADILVKQSDLEKVKQLLEDQGYIEGEISPVHISYTNSSRQSHIEIHWTIEDKRFFKVGYDIESEMWNSAEKVNIGESEALSLSLENLALHLCIHMAVHMLTCGFGIRQLCDLILLVEKRGHLINWRSFYDKGKEWGIEKFIIAIFLICEALFQMAIPGELRIYSSSVSKKLVNTLSNEIISGGVYGKKDLAHVFSNEFAYGQEGEKGGNLIGVIKRFAQLLFPPVQKMSDRYAYARKHKVFIPLAWGHRLLSGIIHTNYKGIDKIRFLKSAIYVSIKRHILLKRLEL
jgi:hypothetical protein